MKKIVLTIALGLGLLTANAQIEKLAGPRIGMTLVTPGSTADFIHEGFGFDGKHGSTSSAFITQYGWQWESRFADGGGDIVGIVEWIALVGGMEQGKFLPSLTSVIGMRTSNGLELGVGPNLSLSSETGVGVGMVFGIGHNFKSGNLNLPVNLVFMPGKSNKDSFEGENYTYSSGARISIMVGFNMSK
jgi:hypothetical protein